jgi:hypothetical protein
LRFSALTLAWQGRTQLSIDRARLALERSPIDSLNFVAYNAIARARKPRRSWSRRSTRFSIETFGVTISMEPSVRPPGEIMD